MESTQVISTVVSKPHMIRHRIPHSLQRRGPLQIDHSPALAAICAAGSCYQLSQCPSSMPQQEVPSFERTFQPLAGIQECSRQHPSPAIACSSGSNSWLAFGSQLGLELVSPSRRLVAIFPEVQQHPSSTELKLSMNKDCPGPWILPEPGS